MTDEEKQFSLRFDYLQPYLRDSDGWEFFILDLISRIKLLKSERDDDLFVIKGTDFADIKKVQAIGAALRRIRAAEAEEIWTIAGDFLPVDLHKQLILDCENKLARDGAQRTAEKGDELKKLRRALNALKEKGIIDALWLTMPGQSGIELHQQLLEDCMEWVSRSDSEEKARVALSDAVVGIALTLSQKHLTIKVEEKEGSLFVDFLTMIAGMIFDFRGLDGKPPEYSNNTPRTWLRRYLVQNKTTST